MRDKFPQFDWLFRKWSLFKWQWMVFQNQLIWQHFLALTNILILSMKNFTRLHLWEFRKKIFKDHWWHLSQNELLPMRPQTCFKHLDAFDRRHSEDTSLVKTLSSVYCPQSCYEESLFKEGSEKRLDRHSSDDIKCYWTTMNDKVEEEEYSKLSDRQWRMLN